MLLFPGSAGQGDTKRSAQAAGGEGTHDHFSVARVKNCDDVEVEIVDNSCFLIAELLPPPTPFFFFLEGLWFLTSVGSFQ